MEEGISFKSTLLRNQTLSTEEPGTFRFEGVNMSNEEIRVVKSLTSCGCTSLTYNKVVKPGETFYVLLTIDKTNFKGAFNQSASLFYSNGQEFKLKVNGTVE